MGPDEILERTQWDLFWIPEDTTVVDRPELLALSHPSGRAELNVVCRTRGGDLSRRIDEVRTLHAGRASRWLVVPGSSPGLEAALTQGGYAPQFHAWAYTVDVAGWQPRRVGLEVRRVQTLGDLQAAIAVKHAVFGEGIRPTTRRLATELTQCTGPHSRVRRYVVFDGDQPVASGGLNVFEDLSFGFLWAGGTVEAARGRGAYSALVAARIADARQLGLARVGLYARTDTSAPIVARQGFERSGPMAYWGGS